MNPDAVRKQPRAEKETRRLHLHVIGRGVEFFCPQSRDRMNVFREEIRVVKRLLILAAVLMLTGGVTGCGCCQWLCPGVASPYVPAVTCCDPCVLCDPCVSCEASVQLSPTILPGPAR